MKWCSLFLLWLFVSISAFAYDSYPIIANSDDGTELNDTTWYENGYDSGFNCLGSWDNNEYTIGLRFSLDDYNEGDIVNYARVRFAAYGGDITSSISLSIEGVLQINPSTFSQQNRPSQQSPLTRAITWEIEDPWGEGQDNDPLWFESPDISPIINNILAQEDWGSSNNYILLIIHLAPEKNHVATGKKSRCPNYVKFDDYYTTTNLRSPAEIDLFRTVYDTFLINESLGRVTNESATIRLMSLISMDVAIEYGYSSGQYIYTTSTYTLTPYEPLDIMLTQLAANYKHYYRLKYKKHNYQIWNRKTERSFYTQRASGYEFKFAVLADSHIHTNYQLPKDEDNLDLYKITLSNIKDNNPDFIVDLGDYACTESYGGRFTYTYEDALWRYLECTDFLKDIRHSIPFYLALGNHEGEQKWLLGTDDNDLFVSSLEARKATMLNPYPTTFFGGNLDPYNNEYREDYFSFVWGDALFVVLDPYHYTDTKPFPSGNGWAWTLGQSQYNQLYNLLTNFSNVKWKFVFIHHMTTSVLIPFHPHSGYGRGGIEVVKNSVDGRPTFEWGGEDKDGNVIFEDERPNWTHGPIHDFLVDKGVNVVFHGHDHLYAKQDLDDIVYQECPSPSDSDYSNGFKLEGKYNNGTFYNNSGFLLITVNDEEVQVDYVSSYLPGEGDNGEIAYSYTLEDN